MKMFSIIVPNYNVEKYSRKCIESILNQSFTDFKLILINAGSTDISKNYINNILKFKVLDIVNNKSVPQQDRIEHYLLRLSDCMYMKLLRLNFHFK